MDPQKVDFLRIEDLRIFFLYVLYVSTLPSSKCMRQFGTSTLSLLA